VARRGRRADATQRLVNLARETGKRIHVLHISTKQEIEYLADTRTSPPRGHAASSDAGRAEAYERLGTRAQMNPPVRDASHREGLWRGLEQGIVDCSAPITRRIRWKKRPSLSGVSVRHDRRADAGAVMLDHVNAGRLSLQRFVDLSSAGPARLFNIAMQGPHRGGLRRRFHRRRPEAARNHHQRLGRPRARAGRRMTAR
jgi:dihydroorotase